MDHFSGGQLEESLKYYTLSRDNGVERAAVHIRNVHAHYKPNPLEFADQDTIPTR